MRARLGVVSVALATAAAVAAAQTLPDIAAPPDGDAAAAAAATEGTSSLRVRGYPDVSPGGAVTAALEAAGGGSLEAYLGIVEHFEDVVAESNCFLRDSDWIASIGAFVRTRGWVEPSGACSSSSKVREKPLKLTGADVYKRLQLQAEAAHGVREKVGETTVRNFSTVVFPRAFPYETGQFAQCVVERSTALRVLSEEGEPLWYVLTGITMADVMETLPDWERQYVTEYVGVSLKSRRFLRPLWQFVRPVGAENVGAPKARFATVLEQWGGRVGLSGIYNMAVDDSPALLQALEDVDNDVGQATDALTPSNIAILSLPMIMNVIPIGILTEVGTAGVLMYTLLTDILTTVPFIIKGFELLAMGDRRTVVEESWFSGRKEETFLVLETWAAECRLKRVKRLGGVFVTVGFGVLVLGVLAEVQALRLRRKWKQSGTTAPSGKRMLHAMLGRDVGGDRFGDCEPFFDPDDEAAAFAAQQQASLAHSSGKLWS